MYRLTKSSMNLFTISPLQSFPIPIRMVSQRVSRQNMVGSRFFLSPNLAQTDTPSGIEVVQPGKKPLGEDKGLFLAGSREIGQSERRSSSPTPFSDQDRAGAVWPSKPSKHSVAVLHDQKSDYFARYVCQSPIYGFRELVTILSCMQTDPGCWKSFCCSTFGSSRSSW